LLVKAAHKHIGEIDLRPGRVRKCCTFKKCSKLGGNVYFLSEAFYNLYVYYHFFLRSEKSRFMLHYAENDLFSSFFILHEKA